MKSAVVSVVVLHYLINQNIIKINVDSPIKILVFARTGFSWQKVFSQRSLFHGVQKPFKGSGTEKLYE
ncbi:hypothetical protein LF887_15325 [Chryseobacterium sp. MEBOG06]|uniref:hypothetical protein n=1 Tax=Chryseobacterium sp. MEBOG06 TaxID=2879938 RepID=UPI001F195BD3|nr:hypothetical protein [Chryseobacterium sp. MEBOG06]UKB82375.1 hypothetical protein LF887_15325 [Chryseobacterium sp. MEBOG06]